MKLYHFPELYDALRTPEESTVAFVDAILRRHVLGELSSVMDPACGPGNWLMPFAARGLRVAGNDLSEEMVLRARANLACHRAEITHGDMRDLRFVTGPFDLSLEIGGTCAHLTNDEDLVALMRAMARHTRSDGLVLLAIFFAEFASTAACGDVPATSVCWERGPVQLASAGMVSVRYEVVGRNQPAGTERIRRLVRTEGHPSCPPELEDLYEVRILDEAGFMRAAAQVPELELVHAYPIDAGDSTWLGESTPRFSGETIVVLRRRA